MAESTPPSVASNAAGSRASRLKVLGNPLRIRILEELALEEATVKELARRLGESQTKLYRHIHILEEHGFLEESSHRTVSGIVEKSYRCDPQSTRFEAPFDESELPAAVDATEQALRATFADTLRDLHEGFRSGRIDLTGKSTTFFGLRGRMRVTEQQAELFYKKFFALLEEFREYHEQPEGNELYSFTAVFHPASSEAPSSDIPPSPGSGKGHTKGEDE